MMWDTGESYPSGKPVCVGRMHLMYHIWLLPWRPKVQPECQSEYLNDKYPTERLVGKIKVR